MIRRLGFILAIVALVSGAGLLLRAEPPQEVGTWASIGTAPENRIGAAAVALPDGRTLIAGGLADGTATDAVVVFDPADSSFATAGQLPEPRAGHTATLLEDGRVLIAGGKVNDILTGDLVIFDPSDGSSTLVATLAMLRSGHAAARIGDGKVLIAGGTGTDGVLQTAEIFDPETGAVSLTGSALSIARTGASATALIDGRVLIAGGNDGNQDLLSAEIYNPSTDAFQSTDTNLDVPRSNHTAVLLPNNGSVLIAGGTSDDLPLATTNLFLPAQFPDPFSYGMGQFALTGEMAAPRSGAAGGPHIEGYAFVVGGGQGDAEVYRFPTIKTDKDDYPPGQTAIITGSGWEANEEVKLLFQEDPAVHADYELTVTADGDGNIHHDQWAPEQHDFGVRFYLMATGQQSDRRAQTTFTDGGVSVLTNGPSVLFTWSIFTGSSCSGTLVSSGFVTTGTSSASIGTVDNSPQQSINITVPGTASGASFVNWTGTGGFTTSTANPLCMAGVSGNRALTANYASSFSIDDVTTNEGNSGTTLFTFNVTRQNPGEAATVAYATADGTTNPATGGASCSPGIDYVNASGTVSFNQNQITRPITITVCGDTASETNETFFVNLSNPTPTGSVITDAQGVGTITNDDGAATATLNVIKQVTNNNGGTATAANWTLTVSSSNGGSGTGNAPGTGAPGTPYTLFAGKQYSVAESGGPSGYLASPSADCTIASAVLGTTYTCTITNDDIAPKLTVIKHVINNNGGAATAANWTLTVSSSNGGSGTGSAAGAEAPGTPYTLFAGKQYSVTESGGPAGYKASASADCTIASAALGATYTCTITNDDLYVFQGFFAPVDNPGTVDTINLANGGQAIPVKWRLTTLQGVPVSDPASFGHPGVISPYPGPGPTPGLTSYQVQCDSFDPVAQIEEYAPSTSGLLYKGDGNWQYNWKTPKNWANQCRLMVVTLNDGSTHTAKFRFK